MACEARREGDEMACACGLRWSVADAEPPKCRRIRHVVRAPADRRELLAGARKEANFAFLTSDPAPLKDAVEGRRFAALTEPKRLPLTLPATTASDMVRAYRRGGMHAAYRVLLDSLT